MVYYEGRHLAEINTRCVHRCGAGAADIEALYSNSSDWRSMRDKRVLITGAGRENEATFAWFIDVALNRQQLWRGHDRNEDSRRVRVGAVDNCASRQQGETSTSGENDTNLGLSVAQADTWTMPRSALRVALRIAGLRRRKRLWTKI